MQKSIATITYPNGEKRQLIMNDVLWSSKQHIVYYGQLEGYKDEVVIKVSHSDETTTVTKEASILHRLHGIQGIPEFIGLFKLENAGDKTGKLALVVNRISGQDIEQWRKDIPEHKVDWEWGRELLTQVAIVMREVHSRGIAHCDMKLRNIMREERGYIVILDWDNHVDFYHSTGVKQGMVIGTAQYMSYEQITGQSLDGRTDIYSLGAAIAVLVYGPYICPRYTKDESGKIKERTTDEIADAIAGGETLKYDVMPAPISVDEYRFQRTLRRMTESDKMRRFQSMQEVLYSLHGPLKSASIPGVQDTTQ